jgi:hypothetical protein
LPDEEDKKRDELLEKMKPKADFYRALGEAVGRDEPKALSSSWQGPDCALELQLTGEKIRISGQYERDVGALGLALLAGQIGASKQVTRHNVEFTGVLRGHTVEATVARTNDTQKTAAATMLLADDKTKVLMLLSNDETEIRVMENPHGTNPTFYSFKRLAAAAA